MLRRATPVLLTLLAIAAAAPARGRRSVKPPRAEVTKDGDLEKIVADRPAGSTGYLYTPKSLKRGEKSGLVVMLHGHGGTPKGVIKRDLAEKRGWLYLSVQGGSSIQTPQGTGYQWGTPDTARVVALTRWMIANRKVDPERIVLFGFSAGGTMVLETYPQAPDLYAGIVTCSAPRTPDGRQETARIVVFLGTKDPNFNVAPTVRKAFEKRKVGGSLQVMVGAEHNDLVKSAYVDLAIDWILQPKARGQEARVPKDPPAAVESTIRHLVIPWTGARGAPRDLRRKKSSAKSAASRIQKAIKAGKAWFPHEAQAHSSNGSTGAVGGAIALDALKAFGGKLATTIDAAIEKAKPGVVIGPIESEAGWHLVLVEPGE